MLSLTYVIGIPGAGKSSLLAALTEGMERWSMKWQRLTYDELWLDSGPIGWIELGRRREKFSGTDALSMSIQKTAETFMRDTEYRVVLGEGARLAVAPFFEAVKLTGRKLSVVLLDCPEELAVERRGERGSMQSDFWLAGRRTATERLAINYATHTLDARNSLEQNAQSLKEIIDERG